MNRAVAGMEVVFHLAAKLHINDPDATMRMEYERVNVTGSHTLAKAAAQEHVKRFIYFSTISVYGPSQAGLSHDETTPPQPHTLYGETKYKGEILVLDTLPATVLRLAAVYGSRMKGNYPRLLRALRQGWYVPIGAGTNRRTLVYETDVASAAVVAAHHSQAEGQIYNVTDGNIYTMNDILVTMSDALGKAPPRWHLPEPPLRHALTMVERGFKLAGKHAPVGPKTLDKLLEDVAVSGEKIQRALSFQPQVSLAAGWQAVVAATP